MSYGMLMKLPKFMWVLCTMKKPWGCDPKAVSTCFGERRYTQVGERQLQDISGLNHIKT